MAFSSVAAKKLSSVDNTPSVHFGDIRDLTEDDIIGMEFDSVNECEEWYKRYAAAMGFGTRRRDRRHIDGETIMRRWVCCQEGTREDIHLQSEDHQRRSRDITRTSCGATLKVNLDKETQRWIVKKVTIPHSHQLAPSEHVCFIRAHRSLTDSQQAQIKAMFQVGIAPAQVMGLLVKEAGGFQRLGFTRRDLYNYLYFQRNDASGNGDIESALSFLSGKQSNDPSFFYATQWVDDELASIFWCDSLSQLDYVCFGDVLAFDATYKTNTYDKPLVMFVGVNHHHQSILFASAVLRDETYESYKWVLEQFLNAMNGKMPKSVVTDGDKSMRKAIQTVFPEARHRLCVWHLERNAKSNVPQEGFLCDFKKCMLDVMTQREFIRCWRAMVDKYGLHDHPWVQKMFDQRVMWAEAYMRGHFWGYQRSTSRCEGMHAVFKKSLRTKWKLVEVLRHYHSSLYRMRHQEAEADHSTEYGEPVLSTRLRNYEKQAAAVYTRASFKKVVEQLRDEQQFFVVHKVNGPTSRSFTLERHRNDMVTWDVLLDYTTFNMTCTCEMFETDGILCSHIFHVMKVEHMLEIPNSFIVNRWTRNAKIDIKQKVYPRLQDADDEIEHVRYGALSSKMSRVCLLASKFEYGYTEMDNEIQRLEHRMKDLYSSYVDTHQDEHAGPSGTQTQNTQSVKRKCSRRTKVGHTK